MSSDDRKKREEIEQRFRAALRHTRQIARRMEERLRAAIRGGQKQEEAERGSASSNDSSSESS